MTSNVLSIGPLERGGAEDPGGGLKAGVAPSNREEESHFTGFSRASSPTPGAPPSRT